MRKVLIAIATLVGMHVVVYGGTRMLNLVFMDYAFIIALLLTSLLWFSASKGGFTSNYSNVMVQSQSTNFKMKREKFEFSPTIAFLAAAGYTVVIFILTIIYYKEYFF